MQTDPATLDYLFDLQGYVVLEGAVADPLLAELNAQIDTIPPLEPNHWFGRVQRLGYGGNTGVEYHNIVEMGGPFLSLIDHPAWIAHVLRWCGEAGSYLEGLFIDECFAAIRRSGGFFPMHSGGVDAPLRCQYRLENGRFRCGQVNMLLALTDIGPGDGGTRVIPGSHKSNMRHPVFERSWDERIAAGRETVDGSIDLTMRAGDVLLFVDALAHGASSRENPGDRRTVIYRYGPSWASTRHGFRYSDELLAQLTPAQRQILEPIPPRLPGDLRPPIN